MSIYVQEYINKSEVVHFVVWQVLTVTTELERKGRNCGVANILKNVPFLPKIRNTYLLFRNKDKSIIYSRL